MADVRIEAEVLARALEIGAASVADAVLWADTVIDREDHPHWSICEVATSALKYEPDVVAFLRQVPGRIDEAEVRRRVLCLLADGLERNRRRADTIARSLYQLALADQIDTEHLRQIAWWAWDALDLADAGAIQETRDDVIDELVVALRDAADEETAGRAPA